MPAPFVTSRRVEFRDTDAAGIMHFTSIMGVMEEAEHEFLRHVDVPLSRPVDGGRVSWPRVSASCEFKSPARFEDVLSIAVSVQRISNRSVTYQFDIHCDDRDIATGKMAVACCFIGGNRITAVQIPGDVVAKLTDFLVND